MIFVKEIIHWKTKEKEIALKENNSLKRKIVSKEKENISKKKKIVDSHSCHANNDPYHVFHATIDKNEIYVLKNRIDCLSSTLSNCIFNHSKLETLFQKKQAPHVHAHNPQYTYARYAHIHLLICMLECTHVHIVVAKAILQDFAIIE